MDEFTRTWSPPSARIQRQPLDSTWEGVRNYTVVDGWAEQLKKANG